MEQITFNNPYLKLKQPYFWQNTKNSLSNRKIAESDSLRPHTSTSDKRSENNSASNKSDKVDLSSSEETLQKKDELTPKQKGQLERLKRADAHVKAHELAHIAAGGPYVRGGAHYTYVVGPDGNKYAIAGEVKIDLTPVPGDPDATIRKAETIRRAALAPSDPSPQDRAVAQKAAQMAMQARIEELKEDSDKTTALAIEEKNTSSKITEMEPNDVSKGVNVAPTGTLKKLINNYKYLYEQKIDSNLNLIV